MKKRGVSIMVVDSDTNYRALLEQYLLHREYSVQVAHDGREALQKFRKRKFDVIVSELRLPGMDGLELAGQIFGLDQRATVIIVTGHGTIELAVKACKLGVYDFITKPVPPDELEISIHEALEKTQMFKRLSLSRKLVLGLLIFVPLWLFLILFVISKFS